MRRLTKVTMASGVLSCLTAFPAQARTMESVPALEQQLQQFLGKHQGEVGGAQYGIDRRLKLEKCPAPPVIEKRSERLALIRCAPLDWRISVPLVRSERASEPQEPSQILVKRGQAILLVVQKNGYMVSRRMQADRSGGLGDIIPVRTGPRVRPIMAEITGEGRVSLPSF